MGFYIERGYGATIDGTLGIDVIDYDITEDDKEEILEELYPLFIDGEEGEVLIPLYCPYTDDNVNVNVDMGEYIEDLLGMASEDEEIKEDEELQEWLKEVKDNLDSLDKE